MSKITSGIFSSYGFYASSKDGMLYITRDMRPLALVVNGKFVKISPGSRYRVAMQAAKQTVTEFTRRHSLERVGIVSPCLFLPHSQEVGGEARVKLTEWHPYMSKTGEFVFDAKLGLKHDPSGPTQAITARFSPSCITLETGDTAGEIVFSYAESGWDVDSRTDSAFDSLLGRADAMPVAKVTKSAVALKEEKRSPAQAASLIATMMSNSDRESGALSFSSMQNLAGRRDIPAIFMDALGMELEELGLCLISTRRGWVVVRSSSLESVPALGIDLIQNEVDAINSSTLTYSVLRARLSHNLGLTDGVEEPVALIED